MMVSGTPFPSALKSSLLSVTSRLLLLRSARISAGFRKGPAPSTSRAALSVASGNGPTSTATGGHGFSPHPNGSAEQQVGGMGRWDGSVPRAFCLDFLVLSGTETVAFDDILEVCIDRSRLV